MKYCLNYSASSHYLNEADEITIKWAETSTVDKLIPFCKNYPNQRINLSIEDYSSFLLGKVSDEIQKKKDNSEITNEIVARFPKNALGHITDVELAELAIPFYFDIYASDWDTFYTLSVIGCCDIGISGNLGFDLMRVKRVANAHHVRLRAIPNKCQSLCPITHPLRTFFIRPEDIDTYGIYIDVIDFDTTFLNQQDTYYSIYKKDKKWFGDLQLLIPNMDYHLDSRRIMKEWAQVRCNCRKECFTQGSCHTCEEVYALMKTLEDREWYIKTT